MGVAEKPGACQAPNCPRNGYPLELCDCTDGKHYGRQNKQEPAASNMPQQPMTPTTPIVPPPPQA